MIGLIKDPEELRDWLKGRRRANLRVCSNAHLRMLGFADVSTADYITCDITTFIKARDLYKVYIKINKAKAEENDGAMLQHWLKVIVINSIQR
ncbi:hypothetical protein M0R72_01320 [Candidatus Pacearchaeota archaeon]|jgi:hypothetical protein|nr:hypothetical protein [Candidatus Pacearchaeota archaeon]